MILSTSIAQQLGSSVMSVPYDRSEISTGIVHVGMGNFHRAHMAVYLDDLFRLSHDEKVPSQDLWGILGAGVMPDHEQAFQVLKKQDCLYTLIERDAGVEPSPRFVGSIADCLPYSDDHTELKQTLLDPLIKIVSMTVTEGGYFLSDGQFNDKHPAIHADIESPESPKTIFGIMVQALAERRRQGQEPFTIMSCDNVPHNGDVAKKVTLGLAQAWDKDLAKWISQHVSFPNSMVDRITPVTTAAEKESGTQIWGYTDNMPVYCEPFRQWVLEDDFCNGRPDWDKVGVQFVPDVTPYERAKIRILNGGHASLCYPAALLGLDFVHDAIEHETLGAFLDTLEREEIVPGVPAVPDTDLTQYWETIQSRFGNPTIQDSIARICYDGANRQPKFIIPPIVDNLKAGRSVEGLALVSAFWCRYCFGMTEKGVMIPPNDPEWDKLHELALEAHDDPQQWLLGLKDVYGSVGENPGFSKAFAHALETVQVKGVEGAMKEYLDKAQINSVTQ